jgi:hypothetical protein
MIVRRVQFRIEARSQASPTTEVFRPCGGIIARLSEGRRMGIELRHSTPAQRHRDRFATDQVSLLARRCADGSSGLATSLLQRRAGPPDFE